MVSITVAGIGYVGLSNAVLLAQHNDVTIYDINEKRIAQVITGISPIADTEIENYLRTKKLYLQATTNKAEAFAQADFVAVATPTNYDPDYGYFDTSSVEPVIQDVRQVNPDTRIIIKSTIPVGYTQWLRKTRGDDRIIFSPEFLREYYNEERPHGAIGQKPPIMLHHHDDGPSTPS